MKKTDAWLLDALPQDKRLRTYWITEDATTLCLDLPEVDACLYALPQPGVQDLPGIYQALLSHPVITSIKRVKKRVSIHDHKVRDTWEIHIPLSKFKPYVFRSFRDHLPVTFYNSDLSTFQYIYQQLKLFPFCKTEIEYHNNQLKAYRIKDNLTQLIYELPPVKAVQMDIRFTSETRKKELKEIKFGVLNKKLNTLNVKSTLLKNASETQLITEAVQWVKTHDPDVLVTQGGDVDLRFFAQRATNLGLGHLSLSRNPTADPFYRSARQKPKGTSFTSYGGHFYKDHGYYFHGGRHHIDLRNSFTWNDGGFAGLVELARLSCIDPQRCARASIGTNLTGMQIRQALEWGILVPHRKADVERFRTGESLLIGDRGGFIYSPRVGLYFNVASIDFTSMFPHIMVQHNISPETINCKCCNNGKGKPIPNTTGHTCQVRKGLVPRVLKTILDKRMFYKHSRNISEEYNQLQKTLKWILVTCFDPNTILPVYTNERLRLVKIGPFIDDLLEGKEDLERTAVVGVDDTFKTTLNPIKRAFRLKSPSTLFRIKLETGRRLTVTGDHICYVLKDGKLQEKTANKLKIGDFLPFMLNMPRIHFQEYIDVFPKLLQNISDDDLDKWRVWGSDLTEYIQLADSIIRKQMVKYHSQGAIRGWIGGCFIPLRYFLQLKIPIEKWKTLKIGYGRRVGGKIYWLPASFKIDGDLGFFLGYFIGDGSARSTFLKLSVHSDDIDLVSWFEKFTFKRLGLILHKRKESYTKMFTLQINSAGFVRILTTVFNVAKTRAQGKLKVPEIILNASKETIFGFLGGLIASDGNVHPNRNVIRIVSCSYTFIQELCYLATCVGLYTTIQRSKSNDANPMYTLILSGKETLSKLLKTGYIKRVDRIKIISKENKIRSRAWGKDFPTMESKLLSLAKKVRTVRKPRLSGKTRVSPETARIQLQKITNRKDKLSNSDLKQLETIKNLVKGNLGFVRVTDITTHSSSSKDVYCFEVTNKLPGFIAGAGGIFTHNCFGYQGYRNARFGRIEAHEAINAYARYSLLRAGEILQNQGLEIVAGIVDSLWGRYPDEQPIDSQLIDSLCEEIEYITELPITQDGIYRWIVFLPRREEPEVGVLNRYYGCFTDGSFKVRGIELRRRDSCDLIKDAQTEALQALAPATSQEGFQERLDGPFWDIYQKFEDKLHSKDIALEKLIIKKVISKDPSSYKQACHQAIAGQKLSKAGVRLQSGMKVKYIVTDASATETYKRVVPVELLKNEEYDVKWYRKMLREAFDNIIPPSCLKPEVSSKSLMTYLQLK
ncbi:MAG: DNA polymerase domain-containing protein [Candidatus Hodarchaeales archaeon]|jgi:DNA polymerase elongation subunit (family B)